MQQANVSLTSSLAASRWWGSIDLNRKGEKLPLGCSAEYPGHPRVQKSHDGSEDLVRSKGITPMNPQHPPPQTQHHRLIGMGLDLFDVAETQRPQSFGKAVFKKKALLCCGVTSLPRLHNP
jgi:hypothetical protein